MSRPQSKKNFRILPIFTFCLIMVVAIIFITAFRQRIIDQVTVWEYKPSLQATSLIERSGMNSNGMFYFDASQPSLYNQSTATAFNKVCNNEEMSTAILGCYTGNQIYIYQVTDPQLAGISVVTAAHETLHAIYARMGATEKVKVDQMLEAEYAVLSKNSYYSSLMAFYSTYEPGQRDNELHSIIGTEVANLNPALEQYYDQYFSNRQDVVNSYNQYNNVFKSLQDQANAISKQIDSLMATITSLSSQYNSDANVLKDDISSFNIRAQNGDFVSQADFNEERDVLTGRALALDVRRATIESDYTTYQNLVSQYNSYATQSQKLYNTINSTLVSSPSA